MNKFFFTIIALFTLQQSIAQVNYRCATNYYDSVEIANDPSIIQRRIELEVFTKKYLELKTKSEEVIIIPMVFHVLHQYGDERLTYEQIGKSVKQLNKDYNAQNSELSIIVSSFKDIIGNAKFEFRLAKIDPNGNCTSGVVYYDTELTYNASNSLKYTIKNWDSNSYLNIWTVTSIESGAAAWSHYPGVSPELDGVVSIYKYISSHTLGHEVGHYLNLAHPWGNTNEPGVETNCSIDDGVDDTPLTIGANQHCNLNQVSCGSLDNIQNFMEYSTCNGMFTIGQTNRMRAALNSALGGRKYLWTAENLAKTGTNDDYEPDICKPMADFSGQIHGICEGDKIQFTDYSYNSQPTAWNWTFEGGTPKLSTNQNPLIAYNTPGLYSTSLTVSNDAGNNKLIKDDLIFVTDTLKGIVAPAIVDMEDSEFPFYKSDIFKSWSFENEGDRNWELFKDENTSMRINNYKNDEDVLNSMITSNINLSEIENPNYIFFDYAYAQHDEYSYDELKIYVSKDCGKKWIIKSIKKGKSLVTSNNEYVTSDFIPKYDEWSQGEINISNYEANNFLKIKFQVKSKKGNYLYIDNLRVGKTLNVEAKKDIENRLTIYPNPTKNQFQIKYYLNNNRNVQLQITNILGKSLFKKEFNGLAGENIHTINLKRLNLPKGIYLVSVFNYDIKYSKNLIILE